MNTLEILKIIFAVLAGLACVGLITGGSRRKKRKEDFERNQDRLDSNFKTMQLFNAKIAYKREHLIKERNDYFETVVFDNRKLKEMRGSAWEDINAAMLRFDDSRKTAWYETGMVPPSFSNNINYHNEMKSVYDTERRRNGMY